MTNTDARITQYDKIVDYLNSHDTISPMAAFNSLWITKLSTRIGEMIKKGYVFKKTPIYECPGGRLLYMTYSLVSCPERK